MADVFLSYRKLDRHHVQRVAAALEAAGLTTWWDDRIDPVEKWDREIWKALNQSKAVLVLWTPAALESAFAREEAKRGAKRKRLVQAMFEHCEIPEEFIGRKTGQQYYDVVGWRPGFEHGGWATLLARHQTPGIRTHWDGEKWNEARTLWEEDAQAGTWRRNPARQSERHPVILVSWDDAVAYCAWLSSVTNQQYRLLSESEWEYCCRSGSSGPFYFGNTLTTLQANFNGAHRYGGKLGGRNRESTVEVDALPPNDWGLYQMHGNAWEWVADKFAHGYAGCPVDGSANETGEDDYRCMRGGSWTDPPKHLRSACRGWVEPDLRSYSVGFRVARDL